MQRLQLGWRAERDRDGLAVGEDADLRRLGVGAGQHQLAARYRRGEEGRGGRGAPERRQHQERFLVGQAESARADGGEGLEQADAMAPGGDLTGNRAMDEERGVALLRRGLGERPAGGLHQGVLADRCVHAGGEVLSGLAHGDDTLQLGQLEQRRLKRGQKVGIDHHRLVPMRAQQGGRLLGRQGRVDRMTGRAGQHDGEPGFQLARRAGTDHRHHVAGLQAAFGQGPGQAADAGLELSIAKPTRRAFGRGGDHLGLTVRPRGMAQDAVDGQRRALDRTLHRIGTPGARRASALPSGSGQGNRAVADQDASESGRVNRVRRCRRKRPARQNSICSGATR